MCVLWPPVVIHFSLKSPQITQRFPYAYFDSIYARRVIMHIHDPLSAYFLLSIHAHMHLSNGY